MNQLKSLLVKPSFYLSSLTFLLLGILMIYFLANIKVDDQKNEKKDNELSILGASTTETPSPAAFPMQSVPTQIYGPKAPTPKPTIQTTPSPVPTITPMPTPSPTPEPTNTSNPTATPNPSPTSTEIPTASPSESPTPSPT